MIVCEGCGNIIEPKAGLTAERKHTPGPWSSDDPQDYVVVDNGNGMVAKAYWRGSETLPNQKLIAAAPDLVDALIGLLSCSSWRERIGAAAVGRAALIKAGVANVVIVPPEDK